MIDLDDISVDHVRHQYYHNITMMDIMLVTGIVNVDLDASRSN